VIEAKIITGSAKGESVFITRILTILSDYPFQFKIVQFPVKAYFAMSINKSQGKTLKNAGIDVREDCLFRGQFYVTGYVIMFHSQHTVKFSYFGTRRKNIKCSL